MTVPGRRRAAVAPPAGAARTALHRRARRPGAATRAAGPADAAARAAEQPRRSRRRRPPVALEVVTVTVAVWPTATLAMSLLPTDELDTVYWPLLTTWIWALEELDELRS